MQTRFTATQLADPAISASETVIRKCVHCGFCTATCPTYVLLGDELDSPRGRIHLIKDMLENERQPTAEVVKHIDRCLSCLACMTTCPSGVNYMHLVDHARTYIDQRYDRGLIDRMLRVLVASVLPYPTRFRIALRLSRYAVPLRPLFLRCGPLRPLAAMLALAPRRVAKQLPRSCHAPTNLKGHIVLMQGCAEPVLSPQIRAATERLLKRCGYAVASTLGEACCGALVHHLGREADALAAARRNVDAWFSDMEAGLRAVIITTSGCGTTIKNYGYMLRNDPIYAAKAKRVSALARDITEFLDEIELPAFTQACAGIAVAYHSACSLQHGQQVTVQPPRLLRDAGFEVRVPAEAHLCCGSAGTYNIFQSAIADQLGDRKTDAIARLDADVIATGNIGCAVQIGRRTTTPVVHTVELLDWATGGPVPSTLAEFPRRKDRLP